MAVNGKSRRSYKGAPVSNALGGSGLALNATSITLAVAVSGWSTSGTPFFVVIDPGTSTEEKLCVIYASSTTLTVVDPAVTSAWSASVNGRGVDDTTDRAHDVGAVIYPVFTATEANHANELVSKYANAGSVVYQGSGAPGTFTELAVGTAGLALKVNAGATAPEWGQLAAAGIADGAITVGKLAAGVRNLTETEFTSSNASYTIPSGVTGIWALCVGSGGGGGSTSTATALNCGGGGGAGQAKEKFFVISGDTTLNITVPAGGAGGTAGGKGSSGSAATIVGNTSVTTYLSAAGGGGGGGGAAANVTGISGASGGGNGATTSQQIGGGGGGMASSAANSNRGPFGSILTSIGGGATATSITETGYDGGSAISASGARTGGMGLFIFGRGVCVGGSGGAASSHTHFGGAASVGVDATPTSATANTGAGGNGAATSLSTSYAGGNGGSGLVVLRYVY